MTTNISHPKSQTLAAFVSGRLSDEDSAAIEEHIDRCDSCCAKLQQIPTDKDEFVSELKDAINAPRLDEINQDGSFGTDLPRRIGPYKLLQRIGVGGMGEVWMAEQEEPVRRRVAIKLTHTGVNTKEVVARF